MYANTPKKQRIMFPMFNLKKENCIFNPSCVGFNYP